MYDAYCFRVPRLRDCNLMSDARFEIPCVSRDRLILCRPSMPFLNKRVCHSPPCGHLRESDRYGRVLGTSVNITCVIAVSTMVGYPKWEQQLCLLIFPSLFSVNIMQSN